MTEFVFLYKNGTTEHKVLNSCTNIINNIHAKTARERWNEDLQAYIFTVEDFNKEMEYAKTHPLF